MIAVIQRVSEAGVSVEGTERARIGIGLLVLLGVKRSDTPDNAELLARKTSALRIFSDTEGKMNLSVADVNGEVLVISQFTLCSDNSKSGNRPSFVDAAPPEAAVPLYELYVRALGEAYEASKIKTGVFAAKMDVSLVNDGPVTIILDK